jgi:oligopeptide/dipeptide ABC transporter ATP-binding protein
MLELVKVSGLKKYYPQRGLFRASGSFVRAVDGIDFYVKDSQTLGLAGESGCGKSTTARLLLRLIEPTAGSVHFMGRDIWTLKGRELKEFRGHVQMIFQDPRASINPRKTLIQVLSQPFQIHQGLSMKEARDEVVKLLGIVGISRPEVYLDRFPHELSGGEVQRVGIARAIAVNPKFIVADEAVASLDMSVRGQMLNLLKELQARLHLNLLFITHDLSVLRSMSHSVAIMYLGKIVEFAEVEELYANPTHPYTQALLSAVLVPDPEILLKQSRIILKGDAPSPINIPSGCRFHTRCFRVFSKCTKEEPTLVDTGGGHLVACHLVA